jgi:hypothetical protein
VLVLGDAVALMHVAEDVILRLDPLDGGQQIRAADALFRSTGRDYSAQLDWTGVLR